MPRSPAHPARHLVGTTGSPDSWHTSGPPGSQVAAGTQEGSKGSKSVQTIEEERLLAFPAEQRGATGVGFLGQSFCPSRSLWFTDTTLGK